MRRLKQIMRIEKRIRTEGKFFVFLLTKEQRSPEAGVGESATVSFEKQRSEMRKNPNAYIWKNGAELLFGPLSLFLRLLHN